MKRELASIYSLSQKDLVQWCVDNKIPSFRVKQLRRWMFQGGITEYEQMTDLPKSLRNFLSESFSLRTSHQVVCSGVPEGTEKFLLEMYDGHRVETVLLRNDKGHHTICVSTQVGCAMHCAFCASGLDGVVRNLESHEIIEQFLYVNDHLYHHSADKENPEKLSHAVIMGMGEPLANMEKLLMALSEITAPDGLGISPRRITISTSGIVEKIRELARVEHAYHLAISLHAPNDALRDSLMPINRKTGIKNLLDSGEDYFNQTGRRVTYEYILLADVNDQPCHARELVTLLRHRNVLVNIIPYNPVAELPFKRPENRTVSNFVDILERGGLTVAVRLRKGEKIDAACGQLRRSYGRAVDD